MNKDIDGCSSNWVERAQQPHSICGTEPEDVFSFADDYHCLKKKDYKRLFILQVYLVTRVFGICVIDYSKSDKHLIIFLDFRI